MKKKSDNERLRDILRTLRERKRSPTRGGSSKRSRTSNWRQSNAWVNSIRSSGINIEIRNKSEVTITLPKLMNFSDQFEDTSLYIEAIRVLTDKHHSSKKAYRLVSVNFDRLRRISTSAALVLTAELSKWDDSIRNKLTPNTTNWNKDILNKFLQLGFFDLFAKSATSTEKQSEENSSNIVKYIKGKCGDKGKTKLLREQLRNIIGRDIEKWTFLHSGISEAITNVTHHAYPNKSGFRNRDKNWYLTGSYNSITHELKIVFYDQGISIPKSLPSSEIWEKALDYFRRLNIADRKGDAQKLRAAVSLDRTSTFQSDRGKGLQDLLEFVKQRGDGYLSILSRKGLYKYTVKNGRHDTKSEGMDGTIRGTLIIWKATLL